MNTRYTEIRLEVLLYAPEKLYPCAHVPFLLQTQQKSLSEKKTGKAFFHWLYEQDLSSHRYPKTRDPEKLLEVKNLHPDHKDPSVHREVSPL
ncbi:Uncharacterised protein [Chlamydia trachomatis]|nr:Uncharacterised protein [Chlamydia trachomatis]CRH48947.1 Uncharacterised protein [Chlamydia trachomatis]CRI74690.1 Uncharacterised protein [Chlamydia trachomatis]